MLPVATDAPGERAETDRVCREDPGPATREVFECRPMAAPWRSRWALRRPPLRRRQVQERPRHPAPGAAMPGDTTASPLSTPAASYWFSSARWPRRLKTIAEVGVEPGPGPSAKIGAARHKDERPRPIKEKSRTNGCRLYLSAGPRETLGATGPVVWCSLVNSVHPRLASPRGLLSLAPARALR